MNVSNYIGLAGIVLALASCSSDNDPDLTGQDKELAVQITARVGEMKAARSNPVTGNGAAFNTNDQISVKATGQNAVTYKLTGSTWAPQDGKFLKWTQPTLTFSAYYPVTAGASFNKYEFTSANLDQSTLEKLALADYMTFSGDKTRQPGSASIDLALVRQMARVRITVDKINDEFGASPTISSLKVYSQNSTAEPTARVALTPYASTEGTPDKPTYTVLVAPNQSALADENFIEVTVGSKTMQVKKLPAMEAGKSYTYSLTVGRKAVTIGGVTVNDWSTGALEGGEASSDEVMINPGIHAITMTEAGKLTDARIKRAMGESSKLIIRGPINGTDIKAIRSVCTDRTQLLKELDLSKAQIVAGGENYDNTHATAANIIGDCMFQNTSLTSVILPPNVTAIGMEAFKGSQLAGIVIPNTVTSIGTYAFAGVSSLKNLTIETGETGTLTIEAHAFDASSITSVKIPKRTTLIGDFAFNKNASLTTLDFEQGGTEDLKIGDNAFDQSGITSVTIPSRTTSIGQNAFKKNSQLTTLKFEPEGTKTLSIGISAFYASGITSVEIPSRTTSIGRSAFWSTPLTSLTFEEGETTLSIDLSAFASNTKITALVLPKRLTELRNKAFSGWDQLTQITVQNDWNEIIGLKISFMGLDASSKCTLYLNSTWSGHAVKGANVFGRDNWGNIIIQ